MGKKNQEAMSESKYLSGVGVAKQRKAIVDGKIIFIHTKKYVR